MPSIGIRGRDKIFAFTDYDTAVGFTGIDGAAVVHVLARDVGRGRLDRRPPSRRPRGSHLA